MLFWGIIMKKIYALFIISLFLISGCDLFFVETSNISISLSNLRDSTLYLRVVNHDNISPAEGNMRLNITSMAKKNLSKQDLAQHILHQNYEIHTGLIPI